MKKDRYVIYFEVNLNFSSHSMGKDLSLDIIMPSKDKNITLHTFPESPKKDLSNLADKFARYGYEINSIKDLETIKKPIILKWDSKKPWNPNQPINVPEKNSDFFAYAGLTSEELQFFYNGYHSSKNN